jgi:hypothetical protein
MSSRRVLVATALVALSVLVAAGAAYAAGLTVTSATLGASAETVPAFYPDSLVIANGGGTAGRPDANDTITITYNRVLQVSTICAGVGQTSGSLAGFTLTITNGTAGANDSLAVTGGPAACPAPKIGTFDLGSTLFVAAVTAVPNSTVTLTLNATTTTVVLTLGTPAPTASAVATSVISRYTPDAALRDTSARATTSVAASASVRQF